MPDTVSTGGGTYIEGNVQAGAVFNVVMLGEFNAEQLETTLAGLRYLFAGGQAHQETDLEQRCLRIYSEDGSQKVALSEKAAESLLETAAHQADENAYLTALRVHPRYGRWMNQFIPLAGWLSEAKLPRGWNDVPPEFTLYEFKGEGPQRQLERTRLEDIRQATQRHEALILLGEPGAGKTTMLYKQALEAADQKLAGQAARLPIFLSLADYRSYDSPYDFLRAMWTGRLGTLDLDEKLRHGQLLLLVDALNEMPFQNEWDYRQKLAAWRKAVKDWPGNQWIFTCRSRDYSDPLDLPQVEIERLDDDRVQDFLGKYLPPELAVQAWEKLSGDPLLELVRNPYYLSMLAWVLCKGGDWPKNRANLFADFVGILLERERQRNHPYWPGEQAMRAALTSLAEAYQPRGEGTRLAQSTALTHIPTQVQGEEGMVRLDAAQVIHLGLSATLLDVELPPGQEQQVRFYHHQLQEFFAARALRQNFQAGKDLTERWRQPRLQTEMPDPGRLGDYEPLPPPPPTRWEEPTILAAGLLADPLPFIRAVQRANPALAARCLAEAGIDHDPKTVAAVQADLLETMGDRKAHVRARLAAGEALGKLGDPRFEAVEIHGQGVLLPPLVNIPAGSFQMGSGMWQMLRLTLGGYTFAQDERPRHKARLPAFRIGQFPVTNAEYACFKAGGGYRQEKYWTTQAAQAWLRGEQVESGPLKEWLGAWQALRADPAALQRLRRSGLPPQQVQAAEQIAQMDEAQVRELVRETYRERDRTQPAFWQDGRFNNPSQPVVGLTWFEALAYTRWLDEQMHAAEAKGRPLLSESEVVRLPTEAEWEYAARTARGRIYPWGSGWEADRANTYEGHVLRTTPVGIYPQGVNPLGLHDLSGNVFEWMLSFYKPYPYAAQDGRNDLQAEGSRVVRGGSWNYDRWDARCSCRDRYIPDDFDYIIGFRVVVSLADSGF